MKPTQAELEALIQIANVRSSARSASLLLYCGRGQATGLISTEMGNPFVISTHGNREQVIERYSEALHCLPLASREWRTIRQIGVRASEGKSIQLFCWCAPLACHCDVIRIEAINHALTL